MRKVGKLMGLKKADCGGARGETLMRTKAI